MEMEAYIGLCILPGVFKGNNESVRELWNPISGGPMLSNTMALVWFEDI